MPHDISMPTIVYKESGDNAGEKNFAKKIFGLKLLELR